jgi:hypothetical protein
MPSEKRRFTRVPFQVNATLAVGDRQYTGKGLDNLSVGGCLFPMQGEIRAGAACELRLCLAGVSSDLQIKVQGEVVRMTDGAAAIKFTRIEPDSLYHLQNIVLYNAEDPITVEREMNTRPGIR